KLGLAGLYGSNMTVLLHEGLFERGYCGVQKAGFISGRAHLTDCLYTDILNRHQRAVHTAR
ncbi:MAG: hypothetical protein ACRCUF_12045, partial [Aeromonas sobria]